VIGDRTVLPDPLKQPLPCYGALVGAEGVVQGGPDTRPAARVHQLTYAGNKKAFQNVAYAGRSEPLFFIDHIKQRLIGSEAPAVFDQQRFPFLAVGGAQYRDVRRDQHVGHCP
jgi:hypothetical protein